MKKTSAVETLVAQTEREIAAQKIELKRSLSYLSRFALEVQTALDEDADIYENLNIANTASEIRATTARIAALKSQLNQLQLALMIDAKA